MNIYFLVEGETERDFYPQLIEVFFQGLLTKVPSPKVASANNYFIIGGGGYPFIYNGPKVPRDSAPALENAIKDINGNPVYDFLILCLDADKYTVQDKINEFDFHINRLRSNGIVLNSKCKEVLIVQNRCIETWFLGNKKMYKRTPSFEPLISYTRYYDVSLNNPEFMGSFSNNFTPQKFHLNYLKEMILQKTNESKSYSKVASKQVIDKNYTNQIIKRALDQAGHLSSLKNLLILFSQIRAYIIANP